MENKINIAELLKDCPQGMELYSPIFGKVYLDKIRSHLAIVVTTDKKQGDFKEEFLYDGRYGMNGECMLFPSKGKTTWEGFIPPYPFNDGDILTYIDHNKPVIYIYRRNGVCNTSYYVGYSYATNHFYSIPTGALSGNRSDLRFATEEEKQKLFDIIKAKGYKWNSETKTLDKMIIKPKLKVGCRIQWNRDTEIRTIKAIEDDRYRLDNGNYLRFEDAEHYQVLKFDVSYLKPFDKVLVRDANGQVWTASLFSHIINTNPNLRTTFVCVGNYPTQCIPYEGNEYLLGTSNDCDDFYKTW